MATELTGVLAEHVKAVNAHDIDAIMATFAADAYVILSNHFSVRDGKIVSLVVIYNQPVAY